MLRRPHVRSGVARLCDRSVVLPQAVNIGENFKITRKGWTQFAQELEHTHVTHMYVSEPHFGGITGTLKASMRARIRENRTKEVRCRDTRNAAVIEEIGANSASARTTHQACRGLARATVFQDGPRRRVAWRSTSIRAPCPQAKCGGIRATASTAPAACSARLAAATRATAVWG